MGYPQSLGGHRHAEVAECSRCFMALRCWPGSPRQPGQVQVEREAPVRSGKFLWRQGDTFSGLAMVRSGCVKLYEESANGDERVVQFAFAGDLLGLEALASQRHESHAVARGDVMICRLLTPLGTDTQPGDAALYRRLLQRASTMLQQRMSLSRDADPSISLQRFLELLAERIGREVQENGRDYRRVQLPMSRLEIGEYLGYAEETVCRSLRRLQRQGVLEIRGREILLARPPLAAAEPPAATARP